MNNNCGACTACCSVFAIPELNKPAKDWCQHCDVGVGCKIYDSRPQVCRDFECFYLQSNNLADKKYHLPMKMRPDRSRCVISPTTNPRVMAVTTLPGTPAAWRRKDVRDFLQQFVDAGMKVVIGAPGSLRRTVLDITGEHEVTMTAPDAQGMQYNVRGSER